MEELGEVRYARSTGDIDIAYQVMGSGPVDLVHVSGFITHLDLNWNLPHLAWLRQLDGIARVINFDKRGTGLSDRSLGFGSLDERPTTSGRSWTPKAPSAPSSSAVPRAGR